MSTTEVGRFKLVTDRRELALPACDFVTRNDRSEFFIDTDFDTDEGRIYLSKETAEDIAKLIGWVPGSFAEIIVLRNQILEKENDDLRNLIVSARDVASQLLTVVDLQTVEGLGENVYQEQPSRTSTVRESSKRRNGSLNESGSDSDSLL